MFMTSYKLYIWLEQVADELCKVAGVQKVLVADNAAYNGFLPGNCQLYSYQCNDSYISHII